MSEAVRPRADTGQCVTSAVQTASSLWLMTTPGNSDIPRAHMLQTRHREKSAHHSFTGQRDHAPTKLRLYRVATMANVVLCQHTHTCQSSSGFAQYSFIRTVHTVITPQSRRYRVLPHDHGRKEM